MRFKYLAAALATSGLVLSALSGSPAYAGSDADRAARVSSGVEGREGRARQGRVALQRQAGRRAGPAPLGARPDATMALRELRLRLDDLSSADRTKAEKFFARPSDLGGNETATYTIAEQAPDLRREALHPLRGPHRGRPARPTIPSTGSPTRSSSPGRGRERLEPDRHCRQVPRTAGRHHLPRHGPDGKLDIYLANLGDNGLYGYCTSDDPSNSLEICLGLLRASTTTIEEFPPTAPTTTLRVTVAHEFFHAVQYAYEWAEDNWLLEQTATWIEDELYDSINDNCSMWRGRQREPDLEPVRAPRPVRQQLAFVRRLRVLEEADRDLPEEERHRAAQHRARGVAKAANHKAKGASTMALSDVLAKHHSSFGKFFTAWGSATGFPKKSYSEGKANHYPTAPIAKGGSLKLSNSHKSLKWLQTRLFHMTNAYARFTPKNLPGKWKLHVAVNLPNKVTGAHATLTIYNKRGKISKAPISINKKGAGKKTVCSATAR